MIQIRFSFIAVAAIMVLSGYTLDLVILFTSVTLHELAHALTARRFGGRVRGVSFTPLGEAAVIRRMEFLHAWQRALTYLAGPAVNALLATAASVLYRFGLWPEATGLVFIYNLSLCAVNLLPVFPLDGGRLAQLFAGNRAGVLRVNRWMVKLGRAAGLLLILPGLAQAVLYPLNISLICMGVYLFRFNSKVILTLTNEFFSTMLAKPSQLAAKGIMPVRTLAVSASYPLARVVDRLGIDVFTCVSLDGEPFNSFTETQIIRYVIRYGLGGTVGEAYARIV